MHFCFGYRFALGILNGLESNASRTGEETPEHRSGRPALPPDQASLIQKNAFIQKLQEREQAVHREIDQLNEQHSRYCEELKALEDEKQQVDARGRELDNLEASILVNEREGSLIAGLRQSTGEIKR